LLYDGIEPPGQINQLSPIEPTAYPHSFEFRIALSLPNTAVVSISLSRVSRRFFAVCISEPFGRRMRPKMSKISSSFWGEPRSDQLAEDLKILETSLLVNFFLHRLWSEVQVTEVFDFSLPW